MNTKKSNHGISCLIPTEILGDISAPGTRLLRQGARIVLAGPDALPALASWRDEINKEVNRLLDRLEALEDLTHESESISDSIKGVESCLSFLGDYAADFILSNVLRDYGTPFELPVYMRSMLRGIDRDYWLASPEAQHIRMCENFRFISTIEQKATA